MHCRGERGFTLVEVLVASGLLALMVILATDLLPDVLSSRNSENLNFRMNQEAQRTLATLQEDIASAGFRFTPLSVTDVDGTTLFALVTPAVDFLRLRCATGSCQLLVPAAASDTTLTLGGYRLGARLIYTYEGNTGCLQVTAVNGNQVTINPALPLDLPAGTVLAEIVTIEYQVRGTELIRRVNGDERVMLAIDPAGTSIRFVLDDSIVNGSGATTTVANLNSVTDLQRLLYVNVTLQLTRTGSVARGHDKFISVTDTVTQRIAPLNLRPYGS